MGCLVFQVRRKGDWLCDDEAPLFYNEIVTRTALLFCQRLLINGKCSFIVINRGKVEVKGG